MSAEPIFEEEPEMEHPPENVAVSLDRVIHERARLALLAHLAVRGTATFPQLRQLLDLSDGNLSSHLRVLEDAGFVHVQKGYQGRKPQTVLEMTPHGKKQFEAYLNQLEGVIRGVRSSLAEDL